MRRCVCVARGGVARQLHDEEEAGEAEEEEAEEEEANVHGHTMC